MPGEDTFVAGRYGAAYVRGMQTKDAAGYGYMQGVASPKHFVGYDLEHSTFGGESWMRHNFSVNTSAQEMVEYFLLPFEYAIAEGDAGGMMVSDY